MKPAERHYVTYFDRHYLAKGVALIRSLEAHESRPFRIFVVCLDELTRTLVNSLDLPCVTTVPSFDLEREDEALVEARGGRSLVEYYWTLTPTLILRLLERHPDIDVLTYVDADLFFFSNPDPIFEELGSGSVLIHEHRFSPDLAHLAENGRFNVGLLCFRNDARGLTALRWWRDRCNEWCFKRIEDGKMGDQLYLEDWPDRFEGVVVLEHVGAGVAPWNHIQYEVTSGPRVDARPVVFYHFHSLNTVSPEVVVPVSLAAYGVSLDILSLLFVPYLEALSSAFEALRAHLPTFRFGLSSAREIDPRCVLLARPEVATILQNGGLDRRREPLAEGWDLYMAPQLASRREEEVTVVGADVVLWTGDRCPCAFERALAATAGKHLVVTGAVSNDLPSHVRVVQSGQTPPHAVNLGLGVTRGEVVVIFDRWPADAASITALVEVVGEDRQVVRGRDGLALTRSALETLGGLCPAFSSLACALDDLVLRAHAHGLPTAIEAFERFYPSVDWKLFSSRWGQPEDAGQTGVLPTSATPADGTLERVPIPDVAHTHALGRDTVWQPQSQAPELLAAGAWGERVLLDALEGAPLCDEIRSVAVVGAHEFESAADLCRVFPNLDDLTLFEPQPEHYEALCKIEVADGTLRVLPFAISDHDGEVTLHITDDSASSSLHELGTHQVLFPHVKVVRQIDVECRTLDSALSQERVPPPDCLFIDARGAEMAIISALSPATLEAVRLIYTEASLEEVYRGAGLLPDLKAALKDRFAFAGFCPLAAGFPSYGHAVFVRHDDVRMLQRVKRVA